jgi:hypothetical protein
MKKFLILVFSLVFLIGLAAEADCFYYGDDFSTWAAAAPGYLVETFDSGVLNPGISVFSSSGFITGGSWYDALKSDPPTYTKWSFSPGITAFGGFWSIIPSSQEWNGLDALCFTKSGNSFLPLANMPINPSDGFWGVVFDGLENDPIISVWIVPGIQMTYPAQVEYYLDNMVYKPIPLPGTLWFFGAGLISLAGLRKYIIR